MARKILIADDEAHIVRMVKSRLEANGYDIVSAFNGKEAMEKVETEKIDLIVLDVLMPEMDGYTFIRELKKKKKNIPVIVVTAKNGMADLFDQEGVKDYLVKPFVSEDLLKKIRENLEE